MSKQISWAQASARRLERHGLAAPHQDAQPTDVVSTMCGAHAQVMSAAEWSIGLRIKGSTRADLQRALWEEHSLIKTFGPRGTVHIMPAEELAMWTGALSALPVNHKGHVEGVRLTPEQTDAVVAAIGEALASSELTIDELSAEVIARAGAWAGDLVMPAFQGMWPRWRQAVDTAANRGVLCFGPNRGRNVTYTNPQRWLSDFKPADGQIALADVLKRYLYAYGPATPHNFAQWLATLRGLVNELFEEIGDALEPVEFEGTQAWVVAGDTAMPSSPPQGLRLLPYFDAYVVGCQPRGLLYPGRAAERALGNSQGGTFPVLLIDGIVCGVWHQRRSGRKIAITVEPLQKLTPTQLDALDEQVQRIGDFLQGAATLTIGTISVGSHA